MRRRAAWKDRRPRLRLWLYSSSTKVSKSRLLLEDIGCGFRRADLQRQVHAFVSAVFLRLAWFDAFQRDAKPEPPHRELAEHIEGMRSGEGELLRAEWISYG